MHIIDIERRNVSWDTSEIWAITTTIVTMEAITMVAMATAVHHSS